MSREIRGISRKSGIRGQGSGNQVKGQRIKDKGQRAREKRLIADNRDRARKPLNRKRTVHAEIEKQTGTSSGHCEEPLATRQSPVYWSKGGGGIASLRSQYPVLDRPRIEV
jgi:hypothetical protein